MQFIRDGETRGWIRWPVIHQTEARLIGVCGFSDAFPPDVEIGWRILPEFWGQGYATEIASATLDYGFRTWRFPRIIAVVDPANQASVRVMVKAGMTYDGCFAFQNIEVARYAVANPHSPSSVDPTALSYRLATLDDVPLLARMNRQLIEDEASRNPMSPAQLEQRMTDWIGANWHVVVFEQQGEPAGYALYDCRTDEYDPSQTVVYLRHFFIKRKRRNRGVGRRALNLLSSELFQDAVSVELDVLEQNARARSFWESVGFQPYCTSMRLRLKS